MMFCRPVIDQNLYYVGMKYTSATFAAAIVNILPALTFIMAFIFRYVRVYIYFCIYYSNQIISS